MLVYTLPFPYNFNVYKLYLKAIKKSPSGGMYGIPNTIRFSLI